jgi:hypothetical protein
MCFLFHLLLGSSLFSVSAAIRHGVSIQFTNETCRFSWSCGYRFLLTKSECSMFVLKDMLRRPVAHIAATKDATLYEKDTQIGKENSCRQGCNPVTSDVPQAAIDFVSDSAAVRVAVSSPSLWHRRFGHLGYDNVRRLVCSGHVKGMESVSSVVKPNMCEVCVQGKAKTLPFSASHSKSEAPLALLHMDLMGPFKVRTHDGFRYVLVVSALLISSSLAQKV